MGSNRFQLSLEGLNLKPGPICLVGTKLVFSSVIEDFSQSQCELRPRPLGALLVSGSENINTFKLVMHKTWTKKYVHLKLYYFVTYKKTIT